ncbi:restriction endonuclease subunit S [Vibrio parahaemolyticus]|uniref:restriction endonuclease subunit S n=1 Tax=Vibrio parahaemolyticus TaxID=670 RepID=UPI001A8FF3AB|nr:restriction endonuclease subunit S [Vibrio parahaemolyticus]MBO0186828.1 restriction endonuclease subunit S [Vibrio parahaemolyticus]MBO0218321.1 restriction endonuclease subunit S [Vibrio parahaemolyticus]MDF4788010.1 restriction endonuclease subunit S [Vibrio parahaemolyticus]
MEQVLYKLPDGWEWQKLADVVVKTENLNPLKHADQLWTYIDISSVDRDRFAVTDPKEILGKDAPSRAKKHVQLNDVIFATTRPNLKNIALVRDEYSSPVASTGFCILRANKKVLPAYLFYFVTTDFVQAQIEPYVGGASYPAITDGNLKKAPIPIPSIEEQKRIVEKLDALLTRIDTAIEHLQESVALADALSQNGLDVYFAELTETNPELTLSKLADFISGYAFKSGDFTSESGIKPIKITNVGVNEFSENAEEFLPASYETEYQRFAAKTNDIVIALTRPIINGGLKVCRVPEAYSGALVNQRVAAITSHNKHVLDFIYLYLQSSRTKNYVLEKSKSLNQPNLSITDLKNLTLPLPVNDEAIAKAVADCNALISKARQSKAEISEKITMMQQLKASILDSAFKGEL